MSMSTSVVGFKPPDDKFSRMLAVWRTCESAKVKPPKEVVDFFNGEEPDATGVRVDMYRRGGWADGVTEWSDRSSSGFEVDLRRLDPDVKILRFYNSW